VMYQWFKTEHEYPGDLSDFLNDTVDDFFRSRQLQLKLVKGEVVL